MKTLTLILILLFVPILGCSVGTTPDLGSMDQDSRENNDGSLDTDLPDETEQDPDTENPEEPESPDDEIPDSGSKIPTEDKNISLDAYGESFQAKIASQLLGSRYMEKNCQTVTNWPGWEFLPLVDCRYRSGGQNAEVMMLNPGPRRLTLWLEEACGSFANNFTNCMDKAYKQILYQSGGQFPVTGVVIEDMDGNGRGNAYAFRNGVTIQIASFGTATESIISEAQIDRSYTDEPIKTYSYGRPISITREQLTSYANHVGLNIPALGSSSQRYNVFNEVMGDLYKQAWFSSQNHIIRAWVYKQNY